VLVGENVIFGERADFEGVNVRADAEFANATFAGDARFDAMHAGGHADLSGCSFAGRAIFDGADVGADLSFERAAFAAETRFVGARVGGQAIFSDATFGAPVDLRWMHFRRLELGERATEVARVPKPVGRSNGELAQAPAAPRSRDRGITLDLRGGHFTVLQSAAHAPDENAFPGKRLDKPARGQSQSGRARARMSTDAFYLRRRLEGDAIDPRRYSVWSAAFWAELLRLAGDRTARAITGYGVRPWRMVWWLVMPLLLATLFFVAIPGMTVAPPSLNPTPGACDARPPALDAAALSLAVLASLDPAPLTAWRVSACSIGGSPVTSWDVANAVHLIGWFLIPLALLTFTGVLRRLLGYRS
jgi:hypothetical protein